MTEAEQFPVVGIGASAGGVEALQGFFRAMPVPPPAMAFVVVTHLGANQESALPAIVEKCTAMPVVPMRDGELLQPGRAYVAAHDALITVADRRLVVSGPAARQPRERQPIDLLFASLATDLGERAIGIVLSGSGSDGTLGLKAIKEAGGLTLAQGSNGSAPRYTSMPSSAVAAGAVDLVIPVEQMPGRLADLLARRTQLETLAGSGEGAGDLAAVQDEICNLLRIATGHDFSGYKDKTFFRRVHRRMQVLQVETVPAYIAVLRTDTQEAGRLFHDLLISVTGFFRDADAFAALETKVMPSLFEGRGADDTVRIWVPGCATGEEAYSIAILAQEEMAKRAAPPRVQIFATDIDDAALGVARLGRYPKSMMAGVSAERLARFFLWDGALYTVTPHTRELCVFSSHNVIRDAPFSRIDLVSCRNMLIYMGGRLQEQVIPLLHYALRPSGFLFLGVAETVTRHSELFAPVDKAHRIFRRRDMVGVGVLPRLQPASLTVRRHWPPPAVSRQPRASTAAELRQRAAAFAAELFAPPLVLVNADGTILHQSANLSRYLELQPGPPSHHLVSLARRGLRPELRSALREAAERRQRVVRPRVEFEADGAVLCVTLTVAPLPQPDGEEALYLVAFDAHEGAAKPAAEAAPGAASLPREHLVEQLEAELRENRERLQSMSEEYETATEELKSANEEMVSVNEELQSINEELETSKEELQSVNEELRASNLELTGKIEELDRANADLRNLFDSTQVATVFLDRNLVIRSFTPAVTAIFDLVPGDRGRPLSSFAGHLDAVDVGREARRVMDERTPTERRVTARNGVAHYLMRLLPYTTAASTVDGVVVTFFDITKVVEGEILGSLVDELNHRVRNMLQVVSAVARHTLRSASSLEEFGTVFAGRIRALARAHELVSVGGWAEVPLVDLIERELEPYLTGADRLTTAGPPVQLRPKVALALGMVLHELATNAAKYGALSVEGGRVTIAWAEEDRAGAPRFILRWTESGGPKPDPAPTRQGFGSELIERQISHDLGGTAEIAFGEGGLSAVLTLPVGVIAEIGRKPLEPGPRQD
ncbi:CheR family methyltransferase [Falsiroseomonas oryziterrae]|uniref:CheR family methyltransferase n=1 Tax=Falsiroseomonas oryziterrae TaxID=2911368 RepID=UPI001F471345|nr:chemotaxis protein CheB [Roseomonas sp. NPKOSM-4]